MRKHLILFLLAFIGIAGRSTAQETQTTQWLTDSSKAIQFGIGNNFGLEAFDYKSISFKTHLSSLRAIRIGVNASGSTSKQERTSFLGSYDQLSSIALGISTHFLWYFETESDVFLFLGAGPLVEYSHSRGDYSYVSEHTTIWTVGVGGAIGAEWFATRHIAIHAEYQAAGRYTSGKSESLDDRVPEEGVYKLLTKSWRFDAQKVLFGLSVYF